MNVLIYGAHGWIGQQFLQVIEKQKNVNYTVGTSRVDDTVSVERELNDVKPTHVVSFIGRTHGLIQDKKYTTIDYLEQPGTLVENIRDNLFSPLSLALLCTQRNIHLTYMGTGCIFQYDEHHPFGVEENGFTESSLPNFFGSSYSVVKGFTDRLMTFFKDNVLNLRIRMPISGEDHPRNFITKITQYKHICSIPNSMSVLPVLLPLVLEMMSQKTVGTLNLTNPGLISHNEILNMYKEIVDPSFTWQNFSIDEQRAVLAAERSNNFLDTRRLEELFPHVLSIHDAVRQSLHTYAQSKKIKRLLVTGGCGFIGSNFINAYFPKKRFEKIVNLDAMYYCADEKNIEHSIRIHPDYIFIHGNLCHADIVEPLLEKYQITHIIHFAAQSHVQNSFDDSIQFTYDNILGTHTLLEACRKYKKIVKFIHVSTDEVYGESMNDVDEQHKTEHCILCPTNPYAATKAAAELLAQSYYHSFKIPVIITRGNNVYGRNQYPEKLIPYFITLLNQNKKVTIQGDGSALRGFLHAQDAVSAFEVILEKGTIGEIYNVGCDDHMEFSVKEVAKILIYMIQKTEDYDMWIEYIQDRPFNDRRYYISNQKLKSLGWEMRTTFIEGLEDLVHYMTKS